MNSQNHSEFVFRLNCKVISSTYSNTFRVKLFVAVCLKYLNARNMHGCIFCSCLYSCIAAVDYKLHLSDIWMMTFCQSNLFHQLMKQKILEQTSNLYASTMCKYALKQNP